MERAKTLAAGGGNLMATPDAPDEAPATAGPSAPAGAAEADAEGSKAAPARKPTPRTASTATKTS